MVRRGSDTGSESPNSWNMYRCGGSPTDGCGPPQPISENPLRQAVPSFGTAPASTPVLAGSIPVTSQCRNVPLGEQRVEILDARQGLRPLARIVGIDR
jgi:hypothetical protein